MTISHSPEIWHSRFLIPVQCRFPYISIMSRGSGHTPYERSVYYSHQPETFQLTACIMSPEIFLCKHCISLFYFLYMCIKYTACLQSIFTTLDATTMLKARLNFFLLCITIIFKPLQCTTCRTQAYAHLLTLEELLPA